MDQKIIDMLVELEKKFPSPMRCEVVASKAEYDAAVERHAKEGRRVAAVSNTGLQAPLRRITFLPETAFVR